MDAPKAFFWMAIGSVATAGAVFTYLKLDKKSRMKKLRRGFGDDEEYEVVETPLPSRPTSREQLETTRKEEHDILMDEQLARNAVFFGENNLKTITKSFIVVVGLGGVGSHAAIHLLRSGVLNIRLVDFDQVTLSSLNRHATAVRSDVGTPKVLAMKRFFQKIFPLAHVDARKTLFSIENAEELLAGKPDYVLDCIDNLDTKIQLLKYCHDRGIKVMSSMGSACKADPSRVQIGDISATSEDRMARTVRYKLRKVGIESGIPVVFSTERPKVKILPLKEEVVQDDPSQYATLPNFRVRILPVLGALPAIFGASMAAYVLCQLGGFEVDPVPMKFRTSYYKRLYKDLLSRSDEATDVRITQEDANFLIDDLWHGKSVVSGKVDHLYLCKWFIEKPLTLDNCVLLTREELETHMTLKPDEVNLYYGEGIHTFVTGRLSQVSDMLHE